MGKMEEEGQVVEQGRWKESRCRCQHVCISTATILVLEELLAINIRSRRI